LDAVPLSQAIVFLGSISTMVLNMLKAQGSAKEARALIDYDLCRVVVPFSLSGTLRGQHEQKLWRSATSAAVSRGAPIKAYAGMVGHDSVDVHAHDGDFSRHASLPHFAMCPVAVRVAG